MGHVLLAREIGPADVKTKAVVEARETKNAAEVRSFLGPVNFQHVYSISGNGISIPAPTYKEWRNICVGSGTAAIVQ